MRTAALVLFGGYVGLLIVAGAWGVVGARIDLPWLLHVPLGALPSGGPDLLSQYRFLRAIELGFGLFALLFHKEIFTQVTSNRLFLFAMAAGVVARLVSLALDGRPSAAMLGFLGWETVGVVVIAWHTRGVRRRVVA